MASQFARIEAVDPSQAEPQIQAVFEAQRKNWGGPLLNHLLYARRPSIFRGVRAMWSGIAASGLIDAKLQALMNRRVGSQLGLSDEKILDLPNYRTSPLYDSVERTVLEYADAMTITGRGVEDDLFARLRAVFDDDAIVELTAIVAFENSSSKFNRALRAPSQQLWKRDPGHRESPG